MIDRRKFLSGLGVAAGATGLYTWGIEPHWLEVVSRPLPIAGLPRGLAGRSLVQLSDLHVGPEVDDEYLVEVFREVRALQPDLLVITGDWVTYRDGEQLAQLERVLAHLPRARLGTFGVLGNHDYGHGWAMPRVASAVTAIAGRAGVQMLRNAAVRVDGLTIVGLEDLYGTSFEPKPVLASRGAAAGIVLCHNPDVADLPVWSKFRGWILAGHTHGGQCKAPGLRPPLLPVANKRYAAGEIDLGDGRRLYVNRGVGHLLQVRFNVRPEVTRFELVAA